MRNPYFNRRSRRHCMRRGCGHGISDHGSDVEKKAKACTVPDCTCRQYKRNDPAK